MSEVIKQSAKEAVEWYRVNRFKYDALCMQIKFLLERILNKQRIPYHSITCRAKDMDSFTKKCNKDKYTNPIQQIMDKAGIRVITYIDSDVERISSIIESEFDIDYANSVNKSKLLDVNQVGYRSVHYIAKLSDERIKLSEYSDYKDMECEIQVRTILQHAWAEIEHDRNYKFNGVLPNEIKRRFFLLAGVLEMADREFQAISIDIDKYAQSVDELTKKGELDIPINSTSLIEYMSNRFGDISNSMDLNNGDEEIIDELTKFGITKLSDIDEIIPKDYSKNASNFYLENTQTFVGILRDIMMINNIEKYFNESWQYHWKGIDDETVNLLNSYNIPIYKFISEYELSIEYNYYDNEFYEHDDSEFIDYNDF